jgi:hypothetical protein
MKKIICLILISILTTSCIPKKGTTYTSYNQSIDPIFKPFLNNFIKYGNARGRSFDISHVVLRFNSSFNNTRTLGRCTINPTHPELGFKIEINKSFWDSPYTAIQDKENLIFHELGHCFLLRDHDDELADTVDGYRINKSLMNTYFDGSANYENNYNTYVTELFNPSAPNLEYHTLSPEISSFPFAYYNNATSPMLNPNALTIASKYMTQKVNENNDMYADVSQFRCDE